MKWLINCPISLEKFLSFQDIMEALSVRVGNMDATLVSRCLSEPESKADLRSVKISEIAQKLTEIATFLQSGAISNLT